MTLMQKIEMQQVNLQKAKLAQIDMGRQIKKIITVTSHLFALYKNRKLTKVNFHGNPIAVKSMQSTQIITELHGR